MAYDLIQRVKDVAIYERKFLLWKDQWRAYANPFPLKWRCVKFNEKNKTKIPDKKGLYAFCVEPRIAGLNKICYLMYVGETGYNSKHNLRKRYEDYLRNKRVPKRENIYMLLNTWDGFVYFYYTQIQSKKMDLKNLETQLLDTFTPPYNRIGYSAEIGTVIKGLK